LPELLAQPKIEGPNGSDDSPSRVRERKDFANERAKDALVFAATGGIEGIDKEIGGLVPGPIEQNVAERMGQPELGGEFR
jgi:hypothetical protein